MVNGAFASMFFQITIVASIALSVICAPHLLTLYVIAADAVAWARKRNA